MRVVTSVADEDAARSLDELLGVVEAVAPVVLVEPLVAPIVLLLLLDGCSLVLRVVSVDATVD
jgi:hypothetical protein